MPSYQVDPGAFASRMSADYKERLERVVRAIRVTVHTAGLAIAQEETRRRTARLRPPVHTGEYARSWHATDLPNGAVLLNDAPHAAFIEYGRRPGARMPPPRVIEQWLEAKMRGRIRNRGKREASAKALAFVVARAIGRRGLPAHRIMARTRRRLDRAVQEAIARAMRGEGGF